MLLVVQGRQQVSHPVSTSEPFCVNKWAILCQQVSPPASSVVWKVWHFVERVCLSPFTLFYRLVLVSQHGHFPSTLAGFWGLKTVNKHVDKITVSEELWQTEQFSPKIKNICWHTFKSNVLQVININKRFLFLFFNHCRQKQQQQNQQSPLRLNNVGQVNEIGRLA